MANRLQHNTNAYAIRDTVTPLIMSSYDVRGFG